MGTLESFGREPALTWLVICLKIGQKRGNTGSFSPQKSILEAPKTERIFVDVYCVPKKVN
jgi:hypothetical protein